MVFSSAPHDFIGIMGRRTEEKDDNWIGESDSRERKQIQDRLAQRARRARIAQRKSNSQGLSKSGSKDNRIIVRDRRRELLPVARQTYSNAQNWSCLNPDSETGSVHPSLSLDDALLPIQQHTVYSALFHNGVILGLTCSTTSVAKSPPAPPHVPEPLRPTKCQLENVHFMWIDRFPLPELRDRMILFSHNLNSEDFLADLFTTTTFTIRTGTVSWDPTARDVSKPFKTKWGFLF